MSHRVDRVVVGTHASRTDLVDGQATSKRTRRVQLVRPDAEGSGAAAITASVDHETLVSEQVKRTAVEIAGVDGFRQPFVACSSCQVPVAVASNGSRRKYCHACRATVETQARHDRRKRNLVRVKAQDKASRERHIELSRARSRASAMAAYYAKREEKLAKNRAYRLEHAAEINARRRQRAAAKR